MVVILENRCWQYYKNLDSKTWEICIDGIVNRPKEVIPSLISYKYNSRKINNGITYGTNSIKIKQQRFMSTSIEPSAAEKYAQKVLWEINVPAKTKASFIEGYNVERESEAELLI